MSHITSISMDDDSARLASRMKREGKNFSAFVRECLHLYYREDNGGEHIGQVCEWEDCEPFCLPTKAHFCRVCWPVGTPALEHLAAARSHVEELHEVRGSKHRGFVKDNLIPDLWRMLDDGQTEADLEPTVLEWLREKAEHHNRFIMPLENLEIVGNAKPVKAEKPRKGLLKRIFSEIGR